MRNINKKLLGTVKKAAESALVQSANTTSCIVVYQPKAPKDLSKFSRINNDK